MILDFNDLTVTEQNQALDNLIKMNTTSFIAHLLREANFKSDLYGWFNIKQTAEGCEYWDQVLNRIINEKKSQNVN